MAERRFAEKGTKDDKETDALHWGDFHFGIRHCFKHKSGAVRNFHRKADWGVWPQARRIYERRGGKKPEIITVKD